MNAAALSSSALVQFHMEFSLKVIVRRLLQAVGIVALSHISLVF
jgi:hypothetical protein